MRKTLSQVNPDKDYLRKKIQGILWLYANNADVGADRLQIGRDSGN